MATESKGSPIEPVAETKVAVPDEVKAKVAEERTSADVHFVRYLGARLNRATEAHIRRSDWNSVGVRATADHVWSLANDFKLPVTQFTKEQLDHLFAVDSQRFELVDGKGKPVSR